MGLFFAPRLASSGLATARWRSESGNEFSAPSHGVCPARYAPRSRLSVKIHFSRSLKTLSSIAGHRRGHSRMSAPFRELPQRSGAPAVGHQQSRHDPAGGQRLRQSMGFGEPARQHRRPLQCVERTVRGSSCGTSSDLAHRGSLQWSPHWELRPTSLQDSGPALPAAYGRSADMKGNVLASRGIAPRAAAPRACSKSDS